MGKPTVGRVIRISGNKTLAVSVVGKRKHRIYDKYTNTTKVLLAHDEHNLFKPGDAIRIAKCKPRSKRKTWEALYDSQP